MTCKMHWIYNFQGFSHTSMNFFGFLSALEIQILFFTFTGFILKCQLLFEFQAV
jgi:hypothetical protein